MGVLNISKLGWWLWPHSWSAPCHCWSRCQWDTVLGVQRVSRGVPGAGSVGQALWQQQGSRWLCWSSALVLEGQGRSSRWHHSQGHQSTPVCAGRAPLLPSALQGPVPEQGSCPPPTALLQLGLPSATAAGHGQHMAACCCTVLQGTAAGGLMEFAIWFWMEWVLSLQQTLKWLYIHANAETLQDFYFDSVLKSNISLGFLWFLC